MARIRKTEHSGAKNGGGHWGTREEAKTESKKARRVKSKQLVKKEMSGVEFVGVQGRPTKTTKFKYKNANKQIGMLIRDIDGEYFFRVYGRDKSFEDYDILHSDLRIQILDESAEFVETLDGKKRILDYSRNVLGK